MKYFKKMKVNSLLVFISLIWLGTSFSEAKSFVKIHDPEKESLHNNYILISYSCSDSSLQKIVLAEVGLYNEDDQLVFVVKRKKWRCDPSLKILYVANNAANNNMNKNNRFVTDTSKKLFIKLPSELKFQPDYLLKSYFYESKIRVRVWMVDALAYARFKRTNTVPYSFFSTRTRAEVDVALKPPYSRPSRLTELCLNFAGDVFYLREKFAIHACIREDGNLLYFNGFDHQDKIII